MAVEVLRLLLLHLRDVAEEIKHKAKDNNLSLVGIKAVHVCPAFSVL
jgi:hypothetical protein